MHLLKARQGSGPREGSRGGGCPTRGPSWPPLQLTDPAPLSMCWRGQPGRCWAHSSPCSLYIFTVSFRPHIEESFHPLLKFTTSPSLANASRPSVMTETQKRGFCSSSSSVSFFFEMIPFPRCLTLVPSWEQQEVGV